MHMHYKGTGKVHSFRGQVPDGKQKEINIQGSVGAIAWRITKFQTMDTAPGDNNIESICKIYRESQSSIDGVVDFNDAELLGVVYFTNNTSPNIIGQLSTIIFDRTIFVRNIFVTNNDGTGGALSINYYLELEEVTVSTAGKAQLALAAVRRTKNY